MRALLLLTSCLALFGFACGTQVSGAGVGPENTSWEYKLDVFLANKGYGDLCN